MRTNDRLPLVPITNTVQEAIIEISRSRSGLAIIINENKKFQGILTLGDLSRGLIKDEYFLKKQLSTVLNNNPKIAYIDQDFLDITKIFKKNKINALPILKRNNTAIGLIDRQDISIYKF